MFNPAMFESMKNMMNGAAMKQSADMMSKMSDEELRQYISMTGMNIDPNLLRSASSNMAKMNDSELENMKNNARPPIVPPNISNTPSDKPTSSVSELSKPLSLKNQGNEYFKQGKYLEATEKYSEGIKEIEKIPISKEAGELEVTLRMNLTACLVKEKNYDEMIFQCKKVLILGENAKAYYRYGQALFYLGDFDKAIINLNKAKTLSPEDVNSKVYLVTNLLTETVQASEKCKKSEKVVEIKDKPKDRGVDIEITTPAKKTEEEKKGKKVEKNEEKDKKIEKKDKIVEKLPKNETKPEPPAEQKPPAGENLKLPNLSEEQMAKGLNDLKNMSPSMISQMANTLKTMDPRLMQNVFKSQGIEISPEEISKMANMLTPETVNMMTSSLGKKDSNERSSSSQDTNANTASMPNIANLLNNPEMSRMASEMLAKQLGKRPEDVQTILTCLGKCFSVFSKIVSTYKFFTAGNRKYFTSATLIVGVSYYFGLLSN